MQERLIMGMPVRMHLVRAPQGVYDQIFAYFSAVDERFSTYKEGSEISRINRGELSVDEASADMREIFERADATRSQTDGYFDISRPDGSLDPSGVVKGWAIQRAAELARALGYNDFYIEAGGDIQTAGKDAAGSPWRIGIRNPFNREELVKVVAPRGKGVATSGTYIRGAHIYNPHTGREAENDLVSLTVIGPDIYEADRFATAAFAMGKERGFAFLCARPELAAYGIDRNGIAISTPGFSDYIV